MEERVFAGRYRITEKIGNGGMAEVFKAQDETLGRVVAIKTMLPQFASDSTFAARFRQEAKAAANLSSPFIVNIYDWGQDGDTYFIAMEYVKGINLKTAIQQRGAINPQKAAEIGSQVCSALAVAHSYDIIHRDIKPHNIMVQPDGNAKVMDFGIARAGNSELTQTSSVLGTAHYVSPEQAQGKTLTFASDLYSLGVVLYEACTGQLPFDAPEAVAVALKQVNEAPVPPSQINPAIGPELESIILCAMAKNPADRFPSAVSMRNALNNYLAGRPVSLPSHELPEGFDDPFAAEKAHGDKPYGAESFGDATSVLDPEVRRQTPSAYARGGSGTYDYSRAAAGSHRAGGEAPKTRWGLIIGIAAAVVAAIALGAVLLLGGGVKVPKVLNMSTEAAQSILEQDGLKLGNVSEQKSDTIEAGKIISQNPKAGAKAKEGSEVDVIISSGPQTAATVKVPNLLSKTAEEAEQALKELGFYPVAGTSVNDSKYDPGKVCSQDPAAGSELAVGSTVTYVVSLGNKELEIPLVVNFTQATAMTTLEGKGFVTSISEEYSNEVEAGCVISQDPAEGKALEGSIVKLVISKGKQQITLPSFVGKTEAEAKATCEANGLILEVKYKESSSGTDLITTMSPASGTKVEAGSTVTVTVSKKTASEGGDSKEEGKKND